MANPDDMIYWPTHAADTNASPRTVVREPLPEAEKINLFHKAAILSGVGLLTLVKWALDLRDATARLFKKQP